jgi:hypothetical protein
MTTARASRGRLMHGGLQAAAGRRNFVEKHRHHAAERCGGLRHGRTAGELARAAHGRVAAEAAAQPVHREAQQLQRGQLHLLHRLVLDPEPSDLSTSQQGRGVGTAGWLEVRIPWPPR